MSGKRHSAVVFLAAFSCVLLLCTGARADGEEMNDSAGQEQETSPDERGQDRQPRKSWDEAWRGFFGRNLPDPLAEETKTSEEWMRERETANRHVQAAAEFTDAATTVVTAGLPAPSGSTATTAAGRAVAAAGSQVASAAQYATGEAAQAIVDSETSPPAEKPGLFTRFVNWVKSWFD